MSELLLAMVHLLLLLQSILFRLALLFMQLLEVLLRVALLPSELLLVTAVAVCVSMWLNFLLSGSVSVWVVMLLLSSMMEISSLWRAIVMLPLPMVAIPALITVQVVLPVGGRASVVPGVVVVVEELGDRDVVVLEELRDGDVIVVGEEFGH